MKVKALEDCSVPLLDLPHVSKGDVIDVPERIGDVEVVWDPTLWEPVKDTKSSSSKKEG